MAGSLRRQDPSVGAAVLLGEALYELGDFEEAEAVLAEPAANGTSSLHLAQRATTRAKNLQWGLCDWQGALQVVIDARVEAGPEVAAELTTAEASVMLFSGRPQLALDLLDGISSPIPAVAVQVAIDRSTALALVGRPNEAIAVAEAGLIDHLGLPQPVGLAHPGTHVVNQAFGLIEAGRLGEAEELSRAGYDVAVADRIPVAQIWFAIMLGKIELLRGRIADSRSWYREGASTARLHRFRGPLRLAVAGEAVAEATLGHDVAAATAVEELDSLPPFGFLAADQAIGRAWAVSAGEGPPRPGQSCWTRPSELPLHPTERRPRGCGMTLHVSAPPASARISATWKQPRTACSSPFGLSTSPRSSPATRRRWSRPRNSWRVSAWIWLRPKPPGPLPMPSGVVAINGRGPGRPAVPRQSRPDAQVRSPPGWPPSTPSFP